MSLRAVLVMVFVGVVASIHAPSNQTKFLQGVEAEALNFLGSVEHKVAAFAHLEKKAPNLPEQGFQGEGVKHSDMETATGDWAKEYGPKDAVKSSDAPRIGTSALSFAVALVAMRALC